MAKPREVDALLDYQNKQRSVIKDLEATVSILRLAITDIVESVDDQEMRTATYEVLEITA